MSAARWVAAVAAAVSVASGGAGPARGHHERWVAAWTAAAQRATGTAGVAQDPAYFEPNWSERGFAGQTVRQVVRVTAGGDQVRVHLSNRYGASPLHVAAATVGRSAGGAAVEPGALTALRFGRARSVAVRPGAEAVSDPAPVRVAPAGHVTITLYLAAPTGPATFHYYALATSYRAAGDRTADTGPDAFTERTHSWYYLTGVDVAGGHARAGTIVAFGDSITDGAFSAVDTDHRYPDRLADLLAAADHPRPVLNEGIFGNRLLHDSPCFGDAALTRFRRDALDQPGAGTVVVLEGINDIWMSDAGGFSCLEPNPAVTAGDLIDGYRALIRAAHARGLRVLGGTLLPYGGFSAYTARGEAVRAAVNDWIRHGGGYDAVIDFDAAVRDPTDPHRLRPDFDSGDHLHPNDRGYAAMAGASMPAAAPRP